MSCKCEKRLCKTTRKVCKKAKSSFAHPKLEELDILFALLSKPLVKAKATRNEGRTLFSHGVILDACDSARRIANVLAIKGVHETLCMDSSLIVEWWPRIRKWFYIESIYSADDGELDPALQDVPAYFFHMLHALATVPSAADLIFSDVIIFDNVVQTWFGDNEIVYVGNSRRMLKSWVESLDWSATQLLQGFLRAPFIEDRMRRFTQRRNELKKSTSDLAWSLVQMIKNLSNAWKLNLTSPLTTQTCLEMCMALAHILSAKDEEIREKLVHHGIGVAAGKAVQLFVARAVDQKWRSGAELDTLASVGCYATHAFWSVLTLHHLAIGNVVSEMIRQDIFGSFIKVMFLRSPQLHDPNEKVANKLLPYTNEMKKIVRRLLGLMYDPVILRELVKSLKRLTPAHEVYMKRDDTLKKIWYAAVEYQIKWKLFRAMRKRVKMFCDNREQCARVFKEDNPKICSGCAVHRYCSKKCQREAWTLGKHKRECATLKEKGVMISGERDDTIKFAQWMSFLSMIDIKNCLPAIQTLVSSEYPPVSQRLFRVFMGYTGLPRKDGTGLSMPPIAVITEVIDRDNDTDDVDLWNAVSESNSVSVTIHAVRANSFYSIKANISTGYRSDCIFRYHPENAASTSTSDLVRTARSQYEIARLKRYCIGHGGLLGELQCTEWDIVDEVWARAMIEPARIWKAIERAIKDVGREMETRDEGMNRYRDIGVSLLYVEGSSFLENDDD